MKPIFQLALDFVNLERALRCAREAVKGGVDWLEAGTPLIKSEGLDAVRALRKEFPNQTIVADMKTMDAGRMELEAAAKAGADIIGVLGAAPDAVIRECVEAGVNFGAKVIGDLIGVRDYISRAKEMEKIGVDYIGVHCAIDEQMEGKFPFEKLRAIAEMVSIPIAVAGGINSETASEALNSGASVVIVGGAITKAADPRRAAEDIKKAIAAGKIIKSEFFKRVSLDEIGLILQKVSTSNISDAMHRGGVLEDVSAVVAGVKMAGKAVTVRTYPGDWSKSVQAVENASAGDVLVIDAGGIGPAVWGELATTGALEKGLAGVVIYGAVRDAEVIRKLKFPVFSSLITPQAGEPKGFGEIGVSLNIRGTRVSSGDWIVGDEDGVVVIPKARAVEVVNRAMSISETENRLRAEIEAGSTLGKVMELLKWEKR